jgi:hypothetical protein
VPEPISTSGGSGDRADSERLPVRQYAVLENREATQYEERLLLAHPTKHDGGRAITTSASKPFAEHSPSVHALPSRAWLSLDL